MDETDWQRSADACWLLDYLHPVRGHDSTPEQSRKLRLYLVALCRIAWKHLPPVCRRTTELAERIAAGEFPNRAERNQIQLIAEQMTRGYHDPQLVDDCAKRLRALGEDVSTDLPRNYTAEEWNLYTWMAFLPLWGDLPRYRMIPPAHHRADLVRCVFGNPFAPLPTLDAKYRTKDVLSLAATMFQSRDFGNMSILADMLEEGGCADRAVLDHCRDDTQHAVGCWVVDLVLRG